MNHNDPRHENGLAITRRHLFGRAALGVGTAAMAQLLGQSDLLANAATGKSGMHHKATAKRVISMLLTAKCLALAITWRWAPAMKATPMRPVSSGSSP